MISLTAEQLATLAIDSTNYKQNQSLKAKDLFKFLRKESNEKDIPTLPEHLATNYYEKSFLETQQYICLEQDNAIGAYWSWFWVNNNQHGLSTRGSWTVPIQSAKKDILFLSPLCIKKNYQKRNNWWFFIKDLLPNYKILLFERNNKLIKIKG
jgi:hypothetical protein|tara:strand:+ start:902 stop:1360 length:459 start_codon:yes stop_codon:yes gene_type:complete